MPNTKLIMAEPDVAPLVAKGTTQERTDDGAPAVSHPDWNPHPIQGWTTDFIPLVLLLGGDVSKEKSVLFCLIYYLSCIFMLYDTTFSAYFRGCIK